MRKHLPTIARVLLGLIFLGAGIGGFVSGFKFPPDLPPGLLTFVTGLAASKYFLPFLKGTETICGLLLVTGAFVPLALVVLAPIIINLKTRIGRQVTIERGDRAAGEYQVRVPIMLGEPDASEPAEATAE